MPRGVAPPSVAVLATLVALLSMASPSYTRFVVRSMVAKETATERESDDGLGDNRYSILNGKHVAFLLLFGLFFLAFLNFLFLYLWPRPVPLP